MEKKKLINYARDETLANLDWEPGELMAFDNIDPECPSPIVLAIPKRIVTGFEDVKKGLKLIYHSSKGQREEWTLHTDGSPLGLWSPDIKHGEEFPHIRKFSGFGREGLYVIENAMSGREALQQYLERDIQGMGFYLDYITPARLITERGRTGKLMERIGLGSMLPNKLMIVE